MESQQTSFIFLPMINPERFRDYCDWLNIGRALYSDYNGSERGCELWNEFSLKAYMNGETPDFFNDKCEGEYYRNRNLTRGTTICNNLTVKTLAFYARKDSPDDYNAWHNNWAQQFLENDFDGTIVSIAALLYHSLWLDYIYVPKNKKWYKFDDHRWIEINPFSKIQKLLSDISCELMMKNNKDKFLILRSVKGNTQYIMNIMYELSEMMSFNSELDAGLFVLGVNNGIIEIVDYKAILRDGKPEDYLTLSTSVDYDPFLTKGDKFVNECETWFTQVFDDKSRTLFFDTIINAIMGTKSIDLILKGNGSNSISSLEFLCIKTLGDYVSISHNINSTKTRLNIVSNSEVNNDNAIHCRGTWLNNKVLPDGPFYYKANPFFRSKIPHLTNAFLWILINEINNKLSQRLD